MLNQEKRLVIITEQNQGIDEESNQPFRLFPLTPGNARTDDEVCLPRVLMQQYLKRRQQRHEQRDAFLSAQFP